MSIQEIWTGIKDYIEFLICEAIKLIFTLVVLKAIILITYLLFTERPKLIEYMEIASYIGILMIFTIDIILKVYIHIKTCFENVKKGGNAH